MQADRNPSKNAFQRIELAQIQNQQPERDIMERIYGQHLIRLSKVDEVPGFPLRASTLYCWRTRRKHLQLFVRIGGAVFVDLQELDKVIETGRGATR